MLKLLPEHRHLLEDCYFIILVVAAVQFVWTVLQFLQVLTNSEVNQSRNFNFIVVPLLFDLMALDLDCEYLVFLKVFINLVMLLLKQLPALALNLIHPFLNFFFNKYSSFKY